MHQSIRNKIIWSIHFLAFQFILFFAVSVFAALPSLRVRASNHHLIEDANGKPFFMAGTCPQLMISQMTYSQINSYFANRAAKHFNIHWVSLLGTFNDDPVDKYGHHIFLNGMNFEPSNINPLYMATVDSVVDAAERNNQYLFLHPINECCPTGFSRSASLTQWYHFGQFVGNRYKNRTHILWFFGNDFFTNDHEDTLAKGIKEFMPNALYVSNTACPNGATDYSTLAYIEPYEKFHQGLTWINLNGWYDYGNYALNSLREYNRTNPSMPTFIIEAQYEGENFFSSNPCNTGTPLMIRQENYASVLCGGSGFGIYGNANWQNTTANWEAPGAVQCRYCIDFFTARNWYDLVPDQTHVFMTAPTETPQEFSNCTYVSAALTADNTFGAAYYPGTSGTNFAITINMTKMAGSITAHWFDPTNGALTLIAGSPLANTGSHVFNTPGANSGGDNDWMLVLEAGQPVSVLSPALMNSHQFSTTETLRIVGNRFVVPKEYIGTNAAVTMYNPAGMRLGKAKIGNRKVIDLETYTANAAGFLVVMISKK